MQTSLKRHQKVKLRSAPREEDIERYVDDATIKAGDVGEINMILPNGRYHVKIADKNGNGIAYVTMDEELLEAL